MIKVTYYMYPFDTFCMISERIEINGLDYAKCQRALKSQIKGTMRKLIEKKRK